MNGVNLIPGLLDLNSFGVSSAVKPLSLENWFFAAFDPKTGKVKDKTARDRLNQELNRPVERVCTIEKDTSRILIERLNNKVLDDIPSVRADLINYFFARNDAEKRKYGSKLVETYVQKVKDAYQHYDGVINVEHSPLYEKINAVAYVLSLDPAILEEANEKLYNFYMAQLSPADKKLFLNFPKNKRIIENGILYYQVQFITAELGSDYKNYVSRVLETLGFLYHLFSTDARFWYRDSTLTESEVQLVEEAGNFFLSPEKCDDHSVKLQVSIMNALRTHKAYLEKMLAEKKLDEVWRELTSVEHLAAAAVQSGVKKDDLLRILDGLKGPRTHSQITLSDCKTKTLIISVDDLPQETLKLLKNTKYKGNLTYYDFLKQNVSWIIITPFINADDQSKAMGWNSGPGGQAYRAKIISLAGNYIFNALDMAVKLVHEAEHIHFDRLHLDNAKIISSMVLNELAAYKEAISFEEKNSKNYSLEEKERLQTMQKEIGMLEGPSWYNIQGWDPDKPNLGLSSQALERLFDLDQGVYPFP